MKQKVDYNLNWSNYFILDSTSPSGLSRIKNKQGKEIKNAKQEENVLKRMGIHIHGP